MKSLRVCLALIIAVSAWVQPAQASFIMQAPRSIGLTKDMTGWWTFDGRGMTGTTALDLSGNNNHGAVGQIIEDVFTTSGTNTWTAPTGVTRVKVEAWGGGGAGGGNTAAVGGVAGGGGGAYSRLNSYQVNPGSSYTLSVGAGGTAGTGAGGTGSDSYFIDTSTLLAKGGGGSGTGTGGAAGSGVGDVKFSGGDGGTGGASNGSGGGGGAAGDAGNGGTGGNGSSGPTAGSAGTGGTSGGGAGAAGRSAENDGASGAVPGGGGSGAYVPDATDHSGGAGASGKVVISYTSGLVQYVPGKIGQGLKMTGSRGGWDITTAVSENKSVSIASQADQLHDLAFSSDGTKMYAIDRGASDGVHEYSLSTAWDDPQPRLAIRSALGTRKVVLVALPLNPTAPKCTW